MDKTWMDDGEAPWLRQQVAARVVQAAGSPFAAANDDTPVADAAKDPFDPDRYWAIHTGTD